MKRKPVESAALRSAGYDPKTHRLEAEFIDGDVYCYEKVPDSVWKRFFAAPSKGRFFAFHIRDRYQYHKIGHARTTRQQEINHD